MDIGLQGIKKKAHQIRCAFFIAPIPIKAPAKA
jgi:hypothetical protein